ncbi:hypothetical protein MNBD_GAMMA11-2285 [hydrothermal vent metagenome]|uniref:Uncharacterized protein n=1 Tax=hydrothermal vent metagenome TaxID=652676 RepID=A0A3B0X5K1_9ZZZZ
MLVRVSGVVEYTQGPQYIDECSWKNLEYDYDFSECVKLKYRYLA